MPSCAAVVLAAGAGTRMRSALPKVLHPLAGRPMLEYPLAALKKAGASRLVAVVGHGAEAVKRALPAGVDWAPQEKPRGTGHALACARAALGSFRGTLLVAGGDGPLLRAATLKALLRAHRARRHAATVLAAVPDDPSGYGRVLRDPRGGLAAIVEEREASPAQRALREVNAGVYCFESPLIWKALSALKPDNSKGEYYLTDVLAWLKAQGHSCGVQACPDPQEALGVNNRVELARAEAILRGRVNRRWMEAGVTLVDPSSTYIDDTVFIGADTVVRPFTFLEGNTRVGPRCQIGPFTEVRDSVVGPECRVLRSVVEGSRLAAGARVGPWSRLRPGTVVGRDAHLGNFCEFKNARLGPGVKANHLSYLGDATVGGGSNLGAGTITANYDGKAKHPTRLGRSSFTGSGTVLVAPVNMGNRARTGAGAVVLAGRDLPDGSLAVGVPARILKKRS